MRHRPLQRTLLSTGAVWLLATCAAGSAKAAGPVLSLLKKAEVDTPIPMQSVAPADREAVKNVFDNSTLTAKSQPEMFKGDADIYLYFLDHPDRAVSAWRRLGAKCVNIQAVANKQFSYTDEQGSDITWRAVVRQGDLRVWYAEGKVKASPVLPPVPVQAVVIIRHGEVSNPDSTTSLVHQTEMYVHTDSRTAALVMKMMGPSAQRIAEQGLGQFQFFFSGLCQYVSRNPENARALVRQEP
jgi:hypothetical protein